MNYITFKSQINQMLEDYFQAGATVSIKSITKNNNIKLDGLIIQEDSVNISPTLFLNYYYEDFQKGDSMEEVFARILSDYRKHKSGQNLDLSFFTRFGQIKYHIVFKLIHYQSNVELLAQAPHFRFLDLAVVFCCLLLDTPGGNATILILNHHMEYWNVDKEQLYAAAKINTPALLPIEIYPLKQLLHHMMPEDFPREFEEMPPLYVLSNPSNLFGAAGLLYPQYLKVFAGKKGCGLYILPSSIHEVLLLPGDEKVEPEALTQMIRQVNTNHLQKEDILSDHPYFFSEASGEVTVL